MQFVNSVKRLVFDLTKVPFNQCISFDIVEVPNDQSLFTESNLANWFSSYVQFCSGGHFSEPAEMLGSVEKSITLNTHCILEMSYEHDKKFV